MRLGLRTRIFLLTVGVVLVSLALQTLSVGKFFEGYWEETGAKTVMRIAEEAARDQDIVAAFGLPDPSVVIQPLAERIRRATEASFVVVMDMQSVRYSHPQADRLGKHFVGGDEVDALAGKTYVSRAVGTLGLSLRAFVPVWNAQGRQIGVVAAGLLIENLAQTTGRVTGMLYAVAALSLAFGLGGAYFLARNIKRTIFGLEPHQIATVLKERDVILGSIKEGVVAIDQNAQILLINENAARLLGVESGVEGRPVAEVLPQTGLVEVLKTGRPQLDEEQVFNQSILLINRLPLVSAGQIVGAVATFRDVSEIRILAEELTEVRRHTETLRAQHHEFLNKLQVISGLIQLGCWDEAKEFIATAVSFRQEVYDQVRSRIEAPDVAALVIAKMNQAQEAGIILNLDPESRLPALGPEPAAAVITILGNLVQNAVESLRSRPTEGRLVKLGLFPSPGRLVLKVADNGPGIPPELRSRIFDSGVTGKPGGGNMGLGLHLVKMHAERFGGTIEVEEGDGVTMTVVLTDPQFR